MKIDTSVDKNLEYYSLEDTASKEVSSFETMNLKNDEQEEPQRQTSVPKDIAKIMKGMKVIKKKDERRDEGRFGVTRLLRKSHERERMDIFGSEPLGIFSQHLKGHPESSKLVTWRRLADAELELLNKKVPSNGYACALI